MNNAPFITTEGFYGTNSIDLEARHLTNGKIFLNGEITAQTANNFVKAFLYLKEKGTGFNLCLFYYLKVPLKGSPSVLRSWDLQRSLWEMPPLRSYPRR